MLLEAPHTPLPRSAAPTPTSKRSSGIGTSGHSTESAWRAAIWRAVFLLVKEPLATTMPSRMTVVRNGLDESSVVSVTTSGKHFSTLGQNSFRIITGVLPVVSTSNRGQPG